MAQRYVLVSILALLVAGACHADPVDSSVSFETRASFDTVRSHMLDAGILEKLSPGTVTVTGVEKIADTAETLTYRASEEWKPLDLPFVSIAPTKLEVTYSVDRRSLDARAIVVTFDVAPDASRSGDWKHLSGRLLAVDLRDGSTFVRIEGHSDSTSGLLPEAIRQKVAAHYLGKARERIEAWLQAL